MLSFLSRFQFPPQTRPAHLYLVKALLPCALVLLLAVPSHAGYWQCTFTGNCTTPGGSSTFTKSVLNGAVPLVIGSYNCQTGFSNPGTMTLTVTATLTWFTGPGDTSTPPPTLNVLESSTAFAEYLPPAPPYTLTSVGSPVADDGFQDAPVPAPTGDYGAGSSGGLLTQMTISAGQTSVTLPTRTLKCGLTWSGAPLNGIPSNGPSGGTGTFVNYGIQFDSRAIRLTRDKAHNETVDSNGTVHGDTIFSYNAIGGLGSNTVQYVQTFHPYFAGSWSPNPNYIANGTGPLFNINWQWHPQNQGMGGPDTWTTHSQQIPIGSLFASDSPQQWYGPPDAATVTNISYTATDLGSNPNAKYIETYVLSIHDQYDNWRIVDAQGNPTTKGTPGAITQLATGSTPVPAGSVSVSLPETGVNWTLAGLNGGGGIAAAGAIVSVIGKSPTWVGLGLSLAGLGMQTVASQPTDPTLVNSPDQMNQSFLQSAYQENVYNATALPSEEVANNLVDSNLYNFIVSQIKTPQDWKNLYSGLFSQVSVTATVSLQTLTYKFYANQYDTGGLLTTKFPGAVSGKPGGLIWTYLWTYAGVPKHSASPSIMPSA